MEEQDFRILVGGDVCRLPFDARSHTISDCRVRTSETELTPDRPIHADAGQYFQIRVVIHEWLNGWESKRHMQKARRRW